jgi:hypothetical protein
MPYRFIQQSQIDKLPDDPNEAFLAYEQIALSNYHSHEARFNPNEIPYDLKIAFAGCISGAAEVYEIENFEQLNPKNSRDINGNFDFDEFTIALNSAVTRLQIKVARGNGSGFVVNTRTRSTIETLVQELRDRIKSSSELDEAKKQALNSRLDELLAELNGKKFNILKAMAIITAICTTINQTEGAAIKLPDTITAISKIIGQIEGFEQKFFPKSVAQIEHQQGPRESFASDLDDDIPF